MADKAVLWANRPFPKGKLVWGLLFLGMGIGMQQGARLCPDLVESLYSRGIYPAIAWVLTAISRPFPLSLAEILIGLFVLFLLAQIVVKARTWSRGDRSLGNILAGTFAWGVFFTGVLVPVFLGVWGFHYMRQPLATILRYPEGPVQRAELEGLKRELFAAVTPMRAQLPEDAEGVASWPESRARLIDEAEKAVGALASKSPWGFSFRPAPKAALISSMMTMFGITGIYCPFTGESHLNAQTLPVEAAFTICHEIAHAYGIAREDEANFVAAMACREHDALFFRYSGAFCTLLLLRVEDSLDPALAGFQRDRQAIRRFWQRVRERNLGPISGKLILQAGNAINDSYLKLQGQTEGVQSYDRMIDLLVRERRSR